GARTPASPAAAATAATAAEQRRRQQQRRVLERFVVLLERMDLPRRRTAEFELRLARPSDLRHPEAPRRVDFPVACGVPVKAAHSGRVIARTYNSGAGNKIILSHGIMNGRLVTTSYHHLQGYAQPVGAE